MQSLPLLWLSFVGSVAAQAVPSRLGDRPFDWVWVERDTILGALETTVLRVLLALILGFLIGGLMAALMRRNFRWEAALTPWLLTVLAIPWLLVMIAVNIIPSLGLDERSALVAAAASSGVQIWALGRTKLEDRRETHVRRAVRYGVVAVLAAELLSRTDGLGAQLRYYLLFEQFDHVVFYGVMVLLLCLGLVLAERGILGLLRKTFLWRST